MSLAAPSEADAAGLDGRLAAIDWAAVARRLDDEGAARLAALLDDAECDALAALYDSGERFRSRVDMSRQGYGRGEYRYFAYPLPPLVEELRARLYPRLAPLADRWQEALRSPVRFPASHAEFLARCHGAGQRRATPLLLRYREGDYNRLHQDLYGEHVFPLQVAILLGEPGRDFTGGEFVMTEQRARMQSRPLVVPLRKGDAVVFAVRERPVPRRGGFARAVLRHGVATVTSGTRVTAGIIFHDAK